MDYTHLCRYDVNHGIALAIDGAQNLPSSKRPCLIICTLPETSERAIKFTRKLLVHSSVRSPCFKDGYWEFHPQLIRERLSVVVLDCRLVLVGSESINQQRACESLGWTFIPIFKRGDYANHGLFQLPIYAGDSSKVHRYFCMLSTWLSLISVGPGIYSKRQIGVYRWSLGVCADLRR